MRRCRGALAMITLTLTLLLVPWPASAGGPTSVLLVVPGAGQTASLYTGDADYQALADLVGAFSQSGAGGTVDRSGAAHESGPEVTVTWLIHDVQVWRVDRVYLGADGGPWVATQSSLGSESLWERPVVWHTAADGPKLTALLDRLGVGPDPRAGGGGTAVDGLGDGAGTGSEVAPPAAGSKAAADTGTSGTRGWLWGLAGLIVGAALSLVAVRTRQALREPSLADAGPGDGRVETGFVPPSLDGEPEWSPPEQLAPRRGAPRSAEALRPTPARRAEVG